MKEREAIYYVIGIRKGTEPAVFLYRNLDDAKKRYSHEREIGFYDFLSIDVEYVREEEDV